MHYDPAFHVVLHQPEIPYNTGSVGRTCAAVGAKLWLVRPLGFQVNDYYLRRAGMDYWQRLEWQTVDQWSDFLQSMEDHRIWYFSKTAKRSYLDVQYASGDVLAFGCESHGLPSALLAEAEERSAALQIPIRPSVRSLNLSNSVAVAAYEVVRQLGGRWMNAIDAGTPNGQD